LETELEQEKNSVRIQTEKLNILRQEYAYLNAKSITTEKENEALIHKLATLTLKMQEIEEMIREKEERLEELPTLQDLRDTLMVEADELRKSKEHLQKQLDERNEEIDRLRSQLGTAPKFEKSAQKADISIISPYKPPIVDDAKQEVLNSFNSKLELVENAATRKLLQELVFKLIGPNESPMKLNTSTSSDKPDKTTDELKHDIKTIRHDLQSEQEKKI